MKSSGPSTLPCGTPESTSSQDENLPFKTTLCLLTTGLAQFQRIKTFKTD
jgi:hypothetical protein